MIIQPRWLSGRFCKWEPDLALVPLEPTTVDGPTPHGPMKQEVEHDELGEHDGHDEHLDHPDTETIPTYEPTKVIHGPSLDNASRTT